METYLIALFALGIVFFLANNEIKKRNKQKSNQQKKRSQTQSRGPISRPIVQKNDNNDYRYAYRKRSLFSANEKNAYLKIKEITDKFALTLFTKVRLLDLIQPIEYSNNAQGALWKIQAKHIDFVICDNELEARRVIELDDRSHDREDRKERDEFVDTVLKNNGYKILHIREVDTAIIEAFLFPLSKTSPAEI